MYCAHLRQNLHTYSVKDKNVAISYVTTNVIFFYCLHIINSPDDLFFFYLQRCRVFNSIINLNVLKGFYGEWFNWYADTSVVISNNESSTLH